MVAPRLISELQHARSGQFAARSRSGIGQPAANQEYKESPMKRRIAIFCLAACAAVAAIGLFAPRAQAQGICGGIPCASNQDGSASEQLKNLTDEAKNIVPTFIETVHEPLGSYFDNLASILAYIVALIFMMRLMRQGGDTEELIWAMVRMALLFSLLGFCAYRSPTSGQGTDAVSFFSRIGNGIAYGGSGDEASFLGMKVRQQQTKFSNGYSDFVDNTFMYRINGQDRILEYPDDDATTGNQFMVVPNSGGDALQKVATALQDQRGWSMENLFRFLNMSRGVLEFGDLFLLILQGFLLAAVKMAAPFVVAISFDREFAQRVGKNFAWGAAVVLIVMPIISQVIRWCAYTAGAIPFGKVTNPYFVYDATTGAVVVNGHPEYMVIICGVIMMICGLCMFASPFISYKLAQGGVFEAIAGTVSGWMGAMIGTGISMWSSATGASISKQAAETSASYNAGAESVQAQGAYRGSLIQTNAKHSADVARSQTEMMSAVGSAQVEGWAATERAGISAQEKIAGYNAQAGETLINNEGRRRAEQFGAQLGLDKAGFESWGIFGSIVQEGRDIGAKTDPGYTLKILKDAGWSQERIDALSQPDNYSDYLGGFGQKGDAPFTPQVDGGGSAARQISESRAPGRVSGWEVYRGQAPFNVARDGQAIKEAYRARWGTDMPANVGQRPIHNREGYDHRNAMDVPIDPNSPQGQWLRGTLQANGIPYRAASGESFNKRTGKQTSTGEHIHIGQGSHDSGGQTWPVGTTVSIPQGNQTIRNAPFPVQDKLIPFEKTRIETGAGDAAARYGYSVRSSAAITEAQGLSRVATQESAFKQRIAVEANAGRIRAADIDAQGAREAARVQRDTSEAALQIRYAGAMKAAELQRIATIVSSFGSTIANQAQGAMQQYNRF